MVAMPSTIRSKTVKPAVFRRLFFLGIGSSDMTAGIKVKRMMRKLIIPKQADMANAWMAVMRLMSREPSPTTVVRTARIVGNVMMSYVAMAAALLSFAVCT